MIVRGKERQRQNVGEFFELTLEGPLEGNPFLDVSFEATFMYMNREIEANGFYDGNGIYKVRFMPDKEGKWKYVTWSNCPQLDGISGTFECISPSPGNHGPVRVKNVYHFAYEDGTPYFPIGTTCYVWNHQVMSWRKRLYELWLHLL